MQQEERGIAALADVRSIYNNTGKRWTPAVVRQPKLVLLRAGSRRNFDYLPPGGRVLKVFLMSSTSLPLAFLA